YIFQRLDSIVSSLFSSDSQHSELDGKKISCLLKEIKIEKESILSAINNRAFSFNNENDIEYFIIQCRSSLTLLSDSVQKSIISHHNINHRKQEVCNALLVCIDEIFTFLEIRFSKYISLHERLLATYFDMAKHKLKIKVDKLKKCISDNPVEQLLINKLTHFVTASKYPYELTFRVVLYLRELINGLEEIDWSRNDREDFSELEQLLIYMNFNSKKFMNILTDRLAREVNRYEQPVISPIKARSTELLCTLYRYGRG